MLSKRIFMLMFLLVFLFLVGCNPSTPPIEENQSPIIISTPVSTAKVGTEYIYNVGATDPDEDSLTYSLIVKPSGMTINSTTGIISWKPICGQAGDNPVIVEVSDGALSDTQSFTIKVSSPPAPPVPPVNHAPIITSIPGDTAIVGIEYTYDVEATDPDGDILTYSLTVKPDDMGIDSGTGLISWIPTSLQIGTNDITAKVSDGEKSDTQSFTITANPKTYTITATAKSGGSISPSGDITVNEGTDKTFTITPDSVFYLIDDVLVDENSEGKVSSYTFNNVTGDHTIHASFILMGPVYNQTQNLHYNIIQVAINAANAGDTILVMAGIYPEDVVIPHDKDGLQLIGAGSGVTSIIAPGGRDSRAIALGGNLGLIDGIKVQGFTLVTADTNYAFIALSGTTADGPPYTANLELEDIVVDGGQRGICLNAVQGVTLVDVHVSTIGTFGDGAIEMTGVSDFTFTQGSIVGNYIGIRLQIPPALYYGSNGNLHIHDSSLSDNATAVENQDASTIIDATNNWWGDATGPYHATTNPDGLGNAVSNYVNFGSWNTSP